MRPNKAGAVGIILLILAGILFLRCDDELEVLRKKYDLVATLNSQLQLKADSLTVRCNELSEITGHLQVEITGRDAKIDSLVTSAEAHLLHIADLEAQSDSLIMRLVVLQAELDSVSIFVQVLGDSLQFYKENSGHTLTISWEPNTEPDLAGYKIYYGTAPRSYSFVIDVGNLTTFVIDSLQAGTYYLAVTALDSSRNESGYSVEVSERVK